MKKLIFILLFPLFIFAQKYELGNVTIDELKEKFHPKDSTAVACKLFEIGKTSFEYKSNVGFYLVTEVSLKIKIYKKEGLEWANKIVNHSIGDIEEKVVFSKAITYNLENGKIIKTKANSDVEFKEKINENWGAKKIAMPNVKVGSVIELKYELTSPYIYKIDLWEFQDEIPVNYSEFTLHLPEYFFYNIYPRGFFQMNSNSQMKSKTLNFTTDSGLGSLTFNETTYNYILKDLPAIKMENYSNSISNYISSIEFELASTRFPNEGVKQYSETWESIAESINENKYFGEELKKKGYFEEDLKSLIKDYNTISDEQKIVKVFDFVKERMTWDKKNTIYTDKGVKKAYVEKTGNVAEINFILIAMLRELGFEANPILVSTRNRPINLFPSKSAFNYIVCGVEKLDKLIFLDATDKYGLVDVLPIRALNYLGRIIRKTGSNAEISLIPTKPSLYQVTIQSQIVNNSISGTINESSTRNNRLNFTSLYGEMTYDSYLDEMERQTPSLEINNYSNNLKDKNDNALIENYDFNYKSDIEQIENKIYVKPLLFYALAENPFKEETRLFPIDFIYPRNEYYNILFKIPEGYEVDFLPKQMKLATDEKEFEFSYLYTKNQNTIEFYITFNINQTLFPSDYFDVIKPLFNDVFLKMNEKIILKKIN